MWRESDFKKHEKLKAYCQKHNIETPEWFDKLGERHYDETVNVDFVTKEPRREEDGSLSPFNFGTGFHHRHMSNNSIAFIDKPSFEFLDFVFELMKTTGEPGFINLYEAARRRLKRLGITDPEIIREHAKKIGLNPCAEILLMTYGVCNLTTVNAKAFVHKKGDKYVLDREGLLNAQRRSARAGLRMTLVTLELPHWNKVQETDRLIGTSLTQWRDAMDLINFSQEEEIELLKEMRAVVEEESREYARELRVTPPLLDTTVKPEGTLTQVFGGGSSGLHRAKFRYGIRRIRINAEDPLAKAILEHKGWNVNPENGTPGNTYEEKMKNARTYVIDFPIFTGADKTDAEWSVKEQFENYFMFQKYYTAHNSSNTIVVKDDEWEIARDIVFENWDDFVGVSFLAHDGGTYQLPPYEPTSVEVFEKLSSAMQLFDFSLLEKHETAGDTELDDSMEGCESGICPIR